MEFKFTDPATDFSNGLHVLQAYHQDFLSRGKELVALTTKIKQQGMSEDLAHQCMEMYCHYSHATHLHHRDEEQALFPLLINASGLIIGMIERLLMDHEEVENAWEKLAPQLSHPESISNFDELSQQSIQFEKLLNEHITREDKDFAPLIKEVLTAKQVQHAGKKMSELRHLTT